ncbi:MAG: MBL fold metallo-hydrolase [Cytophagaceae bacterium]
MEKVLVLGSGDAFGSFGHMQSGYFIKGEKGILLDCGPTIMYALNRASVTTEDIDIIVLSHFHGDHYAGIPFLLLEAALVSKRTKPLTIISPEGGEEKIKKLFELLYPGMEEVFRILQLEFLAYNGKDEMLFPDLVIRTYPVSHTPQTLPHGIKIFYHDKCIGYSGDTGWNDNLIEIADNTDLFLCECNYYGIRSESHLNYIELKEKLPLFNSKRVILTHIGKEMFLNISQVEHEVADDLKEIILE